MKKLISWNVNGLRAVMGKNFMEDFQKLSLEEKVAFKNGNPEAYQKLIASI